MSKGWKLGIGIPMLLIGLVLAGSLGLALSFVGTDGRLTSPELRAMSEGVAIVAADVQIDDLPRARDTLIRFRATIELDLRSTGGDIFVGVAPAAQARAYLRNAPIDVVTDWETFGLRTRSVPGGRDVSPPATQGFWVASAEGGRRLTWPLVPGRWLLVVMNTDGSAGVDVAGTASVEVPVIGAVLGVLLVLALAILAGGLAFVISATRTRSRQRGSAPPPPPPAAIEKRPAPPRPDAFG